MMPKQVRIFCKYPASLIGYFSTINLLFIIKSNCYEVSRVEDHLKSSEKHGRLVRKGTVAITQRYILFKKLQSQSAEQFRDIDIDEFDLNITENVEEAE